MNALTLVLLLLGTFVVGLVLGAAAVAAAVRRQRRASGEDRQAAVEAAVAQVLAERSATAETVTADRDRTVEALVGVAATTLDARLQAGSKELDLRSATFDERVGSIDARLQQIGDVVAELQREKAAQHSQLLTELQSTATRSRELHETTAQLRDVLASPKSRGQWGERMADDVLQAAGFVEGVNYRKQTALAGGGVPDFTFFLPRGLELNMDVKFPVDNYVRFLDADDDLRRDQARRSFARDVRHRVKEIADRSYIDPDRTVDTVVLFIPNEGVYAFLHENDGDLIDHALRQKVVLCSPLTLFSVLAVIRQAVDSFRLERRGDEILEYLNGFRGEWSKFTEQLDKVGKHLGTLQNSYDSLQGTRRSVFERQLQRIDELEAGEASGPAAPDPLPLPDGDPPVEPAPPLREVG